MQLTREILENTITGIGEIPYWTYQPHVDAFYMNKYMERLTGTSHLNGNTSLEAYMRLIHPEDVKLFHEAIKSIENREKEKATIVYRLQNQQHYTWIHSTIGSVHDQAREVTTIIGFPKSRPAPEKRHTETPTNQQMVLYSKILQNIPAIILLTDAKANIVYANPFMRSLTGYKQNELIGKNTSLFKSGKMEAHFYAEMWAKLKNGEKFSGEFINRKKNGEIYREQSQIVPIQDENGENVQYLKIGIDITEKRKAEEKLIESEKELTALVNNMSDIAWKVDSQGKYTYFSDNIEKIAGYKPSELIGKTPFDIMPEDEKENARIFFEQRRKNHERFSDFEKKIVTKDGAIVYLTATGVPFFDEENNLLGYTGVDKDITKEKNQQVALKASEEKFRSIVENVNEGIMVYKGGQHIYASAAYLNMLGFHSLDELNKARSIHENVHPEDKKYLLKAINNSIEKKQATFKVRYRVRHKKGHYIWREDTSRNIFDHTGKLQRTYVIARDITQEVVREEKLKKIATMVEQTGEAIMATDKDFKINFVNTAFESMFGYTKDEVIGLQPDFFNADKDPALQQKIYEAARREEKYSTLLVNRRKDGSRFYIRISITPIYGVNKQLAGFLSVNTDVTVEERLKQQIINQEKMVALGTVAGSVSHEFNNILQIIETNKEVVQSLADNSEELGPFLGAIEDAANKGKNIIASLRDYARENKQSSESFHLGKTITLEKQNIRKQVKPAIRSKFSMHSDTKININKSDISKILFHLINNANEALENKKEGNIEIITRDVHDPVDRHGITQKGQWVMLAVKDNGKGIAEKHLARVYDLFYTTKNVGQGSGMGLSIVARIAERSGGFVKIQSRENNGTTASIFFPV